MLRANSYQISVLLDDNIQYIVPPYQRNYVWTKDKWDRLWNDILEAAAHPERPEHFLGAIVIRQEQDEPGLPKQRTIVDGQQRLTTVQVILAVLRDLAQKHDLPELAEQAHALMLNAAAAPEQRLKVVTSLVDLDAFLRLATAGGVPPTSEEDPPLAQAYRHFHEAMGKHVRSSLRPADTLATILRTLSLRLYFVLMTLTEADDEQAIYERLNSLGEHLRKSELIRNHVLHRRHKRDLIPPKSTYEDYWVRLDDLPPTKVDAFLRSYLIMHRVKIIPQDRLFIEFRDHVAEHEDDLTGLLKQIVRAGEVYKAIVTGTGLVGYERRLAAHLAAMRSHVFVPVLMRLFLMGDDAVQRGRALAVLDSYLLRRFVCRGSTNHYAGLVPQMLKRLAQGGDPALALQTILRAQVGPRAWPSDDDVKAGLRTWDTRGPGKTFGNKHVAKELILLAEVQLSTSHIEPIEFRPATLTVEHLMPQAWRDSGWPVDAATDELAEAERRERGWAVHTLGNVTLITGDLNHFLGDKPWAEKYSHLRKSRLQLNRALPATFASVAHIVARGEQLAELICAALPAPDAVATMPAALAAMPTDLVDEPVEAFEENEEIEAFAESEEPDDRDSDSDSDFNGDEPAEPAEGTAPAGGGPLPQVDTSLSHNKRILAALAFVDGGPLTFREIAAATAVRAPTVRYYLKIRSIPGVDTTTKDGLIAGVLKRPSPRR